MALTKADGFDAVLGELSESIERAREGDRDDALNVCDDIVEALGMLNMRLSKLEAEQ